MSNNGHSIVLEIKQSTKHTSLPRISYGGLGGTYEIQELHFHWGINYNEGSEHRISGTSFPIELHMVHKKVGDKFDKNSMDLNEFAILSMMFQISTSQNSKLDPIIEGIHELREKEINRTLVMLQINKILPRNVTEFFRYEGSFTVPSCNETVIWTVFKEPLNISKYQLYLFKQFKYPNSTTRIMNNYREVQPLNGRIVFDVTTDKLI
ncbi:putative carbonic anhydrase 5 [Lepeophtheirus salmonis]|uniref:putative carbonic anhydrase 5 n=1 Tax=Lepeophtheirus salmonis TaxID=72036 RepID=UPI001AE8F343|nr:carbonic anhydrase 4-like [Lepeophtheirus salmonis]